MINNINLKKDFFINIDGEIYACRFRVMEVDVTSLTDRELIDFSHIGNGTYLHLFSKEEPYLYSNVGIDRINIEVCGGIGMKHWWSKRGDSEFDPRKIYESADDCIAEKNGVIELFCNRFTLTTPYTISLNKITPSELSWEDMGLEYFGRYHYWKLFGWAWNRTRPEYIKAGDTPKSVSYDLVKEQITYKNLKGLKFYPTAEECSTDNSVKVHYFND